MKRAASHLKKKRVFLLFFFAFLIRLIAVDQSLWLDEATTAMAVKTYSFAQIMIQFSPFDFHPPLYYLLMKLWTIIFGYSEIALRMPSILFSLGAGWMIYKIGGFGLFRKSGSKNGAGFWATAFFLFNPLIIYYSQEARMYSMVTFTVSASFYFLVQVLKADRLNRDFLLMNLFLILSFYTFYASIFYIAAVCLFLVIKKWYKIFFLTFAIWVLIFIIIYPLLYQQILNSRETLTLIPNWSSVLGNVSLKNLLLIPLKFTSGRISFGPKMLYYLLAGVWMIVLGSLGVLGRVRGVWDFRVVKMLIFFFCVPIILGIIFSFVSPLLQYFRFQYLIVFLSLLLSYSVNSLPFFYTSSPRGARVRQLADQNKVASLKLIHQLAPLVFIGFLSWSLFYLLNPQFHREDWKNLAQILKNGKAPIYMILSSSDPLKYYAPELEVRDLRRLGSLGGLGREIIIIPYTTDIHGVNYTDIVSNLYRQKKVSSVRQLTYETWSKE